MHRAKKHAKHVLLQFSNMAYIRNIHWKEDDILKSDLKKYVKEDLKGGDRRVRIFSAHNNWWATPEVSLLLLYQRSAKVFLNFLRQGVKTMYYFKNMHSKSLKCAK